MTTVLIPLEPAPLMESIPDPVQRFLDQSRARNTVRAYRSHWLQFETWCRQSGSCPLPASPETIAQYLGAQAGRLKPTSLEQHLAAITKAHKAAELSSPVQGSVLIAEVLKGIKRTFGTAARQKAAILTDDLRIMLRHLPASILGLRDRALLLVGFAGAFRRSELVALDVEDFSFTPEGLLITLRRSKTDQEGAGRVIAIPYGAQDSTCPVQALQAWLEAAGITTGPVFRPINRHGRVSDNRLSAEAVADKVKAYVEASGLDPKRYAGHSLRAGLVTSAARAKVPLQTIMAQTGHASVDMVMRYIRRANSFSENAVGALGL